MINPNQSRKEFKSWLARRGLREHTSNSKRLQTMSIHELQDRKIVSIKEDKHDVISAFGFPKREIAKRNLEEMCPYKLNITSPAPKFIQFPENTDGFWYFTGDIVGFEFEKEKTWYIMTKDLTNSTDML